MNKSESKYFNTAAKMDEALIALLEKKDFEYISVKEICEAADVNRSTFYLHYENTRDLLEESIRYMNDRFLSYFPQDGKTVIGKIENCPEEELFLVTPEYLTPYLTYIRDHKRIFMTAMRNPEVFHADAAYRDMFRYIFNPILERFHVPAQERHYRMAFYIHGCMGIVSEWLKNDCSEPIESVIAIFERCVFGGEKRGKLF